MPPPGPPRDSQSSMRTTHPTPIIVPKPKVKYSTVLRPPWSAPGLVVSDEDIPPQLYIESIDAPSTSRVVQITALRAAGDLHAPAAHRGSARPRRRHRRRPLRRRHVVPARRAVRAARDQE